MSETCSDCQWIVIDEVSQIILCRRHMSVDRLERELSSAKEMDDVTVRVIKGLNMTICELRAGVHGYIADIHSLKDQNANLTTRLAQAEQALKSYTTFHNGSSWVTTTVGDMPRYESEDAAIEGSKTIGHPFEALSSIERIGALEGELQVEREAVVFFRNKAVDAQVLLEAARGEVGKILAYLDEHGWSHDEPSIADVVIRTLEAEREAIGNLEKTQASLKEFAEGCEERENEARGEVAFAVRGLTDIGERACGALCSELPLNQHHAVCSQVFNVREQLSAKEGE